MAVQTPFKKSTDRWAVTLSNTWDVLGPFPIHAREQHYLSPSYPLNLSAPIDFTKSYLSSLADNGEVFWHSCTSDPAGELKVSYPGIRWDMIRSTEGWAGLQHHSVMRTFVTVYPQDAQLAPVVPPRLLVNLVQGSYFTILPTLNTRASAVPKWYSGDIYGMESALPRPIELPTPPSLTSPTTYELFVSGDYEIRLFGDPQVYSSNNIPTLSLKLSIEAECSISELVLVPSLGVVPDFVSGWAFGDAVGVSVRSTSSRWLTVKDVVSYKLNPIGVQLELLSMTSIAPTQTRLIPLKLTQTGPFQGTEFTFDLVVETEAHLSSESGTFVVPVVLNFIHLPHWSLSSSGPSVVKATYFYSSSTPTAFLVKPPIEENKVDGIPEPPIIALHGAGVDMFSTTFWSDALPRQLHSWTIMPSGRTSWGLDWHGPSTKDVWSCLAALIDLLDKHPSRGWNPWKIAHGTRVVLMGHSNGGQGAWHICGRYPDRVLAAVPAAAYVKSQAYVTLAQSRSAHFIDPALRSILETSLTPDDNDLFLSNLVDTPILAVHGGDDENVPTWHTREAVSVLKTWNPYAPVRMKEDRGKPHWYDSVFSDHAVQAFVHAHLATYCVRASTQTLKHGLGSFTLTVAIPVESGALHGIRVERLIPGRLSRIYVNRGTQIAWSMQTTNVLQFTISLVDFEFDAVNVDGKEFSLKDYDTSPGLGLVRFRRNSERKWEIAFPPDTSSDIQPSGRLSLILTSMAPILLVIPTLANSSLSSGLELLYALRISHDLKVYHKMDTEIVHDTEVVRRYQDGSLSTGNIVIIDGPHKTSFGRDLLLRKLTDLRLSDERLLFLNDFSLNGPSTGLAFLHPHPTSSTACVLFLRAEDESGMENIMRLFPVRTGVMVPDWVFVGPNVQIIGAAGVRGAGVWGNGWKEGASWFN